MKNTVQSLGQQAATGEGPADRLFREVNDPTSIWQDLRLTVMSGFDYVFAPDAFCRQFRQLRQLQQFLIKIRILTGSSRTRSVLVAYWYDRNKHLHFEKYQLAWSGNQAVSWSKLLLDGSPQAEYMALLFKHSEALIPEP